MVIFDRRRPLVSYYRTNSLFKFCNFNDMGAIVNCNVYFKIRISLFWHVVVFNIIRVFFQFTSIIIMIPLLFNRTI